MRQPLEIRAADYTPGQTIEATFAAPVVVEADESGERRIISGTAVTFGDVGYTSIGPVRYLPGSLNPHAAHVSVDRDHDISKVIGVVRSAKATDTGITAKLRVSKTVLGDETLALAEDGALTGLSTTTRPTAYSFEEDDEHGLVMVVESADWVGLAVVSQPAFTNARISKVAASAASTPKKGHHVNIQQLLYMLRGATEAERPAILAAHREVIEASGFTNEALVALVAAPEQAPAVAPIAAAATPHKFVSAGDYVSAYIWATVKNDSAAKALIEAALNDVTTGENVGIVPPSYSSDIIGGLPIETPVLDQLVRRTDLPPTGMSIISPKWTELPHGDWNDTENVQPATNDVTIGTVTTAIHTWSHAVKASINLIERSAFGGFAQAYFEQATINYLSALETRTIATMVAAASVPGSSASDTLTRIADLVVASVAAQLDGSATPNFRGLRPNFVALGSAAWKNLFLTTTANGPAFASGNVDLGSLTSNLAGIKAVLVPGMVSTGVLVGSSLATKVQATRPLQLRSTVVNTMSVELGVLANAAFSVDYPLALQYDAS